MVQIAYARGWAETRWLGAAVEGESVRVRADYDSDTGGSPCLVDLERSTIHRHDDALCFDLVLHFGPSSWTERWQGELRMQ